GTARRTTTGRPLTRFRIATPPHGSPTTTRAAGTTSDTGTTSAASTTSDTARARTTGPATVTARRDRPRHLPTVPAIPAVPGIPTFPAITAVRWERAGTTAVHRTPPARTQMAAVARQKATLLADLRTVDDHRSLRRVQLLLRHLGDERTTSRRERRREESATRSTATRPSPLCTQTLRTNRHWTS